MKPSFPCFFFGLRIVSSPKAEEEKKPEVTNEAPRIVFDDAMKQKQLIHNISTDILGNGIRYPFVVLVFSCDCRVPPKRVSALRIS